MKSTEKEGLIFGPFEAVIYVVIIVVHFAHFNQAKDLNHLTDNIMPVASYNEIFTVSQSMLAHLFEL